MVQVCINRPNRKRIRHFTEKDVIRISKFAIDNGASPIKILGSVAVVAGFGFIFCVAARSIDNTGKLTKLAVKIGGIAAIAKLTDFILTVLTGGLFRRLLLVRRIASILILTIAVFTGIQRALRSTIADAELITEMSALAHDLCSAAKQATIEAGEVISDKFSNVADISDETLEDLADKFGDIDLSS